MKKRPKVYATTYYDPQGINVHYFFPYTKSDNKLFLKEKNYDNVLRVVEQKWRQNYGPSISYTLNTARSILGNKLFDETFSNGFEGLDIISFNDYLNEKIICLDYGTSSPKFIYGNSQTAGPKHKVKEINCPYLHRSSIEINSSDLFQKDFPLKKVTIGTENSLIIINQIVGGSSVYDYKFPETNQNQFDRLTISGLSFTKSWNVEVLDTLRLDNIATAKDIELNVICEKAEITAKLGQELPTNINIKCADNHKSIIFTSLTANRPISQSWGKVDAREVFIEGISLCFNEVIRCQKLLDKTEHYNNVVRIKYLDCSAPFPLIINNSALSPGLNVIIIDRISNDGEIQKASSSGPVGIIYGNECFILGEEKLTLKKEVGDKPFNKSLHDEHKIKEAILDTDLDRVTPEFIMQTMPARVLKIGETL